MILSVGSLALQSDRDKIVCSNCGAVAWLSPSLFDTHTRCNQPKDNCTIDDQQLQDHIQRLTGRCASLISLSQLLISWQSPLVIVMTYDRR